MFVLAAALYEGYTNDRLYELTKIDKWFLNKLRNIVSYHKKMEQMTVSCILIFDWIRFDEFIKTSTCNMSLCFLIVCVIFFLDAFCRWRTCIIRFCWRQSHLDFLINRLPVPSKGELYLLMCDSLC